MDLCELTQATYVPSEPPRDGVLALWGDMAGDTPIELVVTSGKIPRRTKVDARVIPMSRAIPRLLTVGEGASPAVAAWSAAVTAGVDLVARGRLVSSGEPPDSWRVGPLDAADELRLRDLAAALPPEAHALPLSGFKRIRLHSPESLVRALWDATADVLASGLSPDGVGQRPYGAEVLIRVEPRIFHPPGATRPDTEFWAVPALRSLADPSLVVEAAELRHAGEAVLERLGGQAETQLRMGLRRGAGVWAPLGRALEGEVLLTDAELFELLNRGGRALADVGIPVLWPQGLFTGKIKARGGAEKLSTDAGKTFDIKDLLDFRWRVSLGDEELSQAEVSELAEAKRPLVRVRGHWVKADAELLAKLRRKKRVLTGGQALNATLSGSIEIDGRQVAFAPPPELGSLVGRMKEIEGVQVEPSADLRATLRPYQRAGLAWLANMTELGLGACLADDMGLGKTIQLIALHLHRRPLRAGPTLVVCPTSLLGNWEREFARFAPVIPVRRFHGGERNLAGLAPAEVVLVTYGVLRRDSAALAAIDWGLVAADEAQHGKNPKSATAKALRKIGSGVRVVLTGTPIENRLTELWSLLDWTNPGLLGSLDHFRRTMARPIERSGDPVTTERLAAVVRPFLLRRKKSDPDIAPELPGKTETDRFVPLTAEQTTLYEAVVRENLAEIKAAQGVQRAGQVLKLLTELKQICNHPAQYLKEDGPIPGRSGKLAAFDELLDVILDEGESVLVFSQYVRLCKLLAARLAERGLPAELLSGSSSPAERDRMVRDFQAGEFPVFLLSLKAGGVGLNLTRATHVIHFDRWWNPAVEDQATDRAHRIGQHHPVQVHRLIAEGTLEERIATMLRTKRKLAESIVGSGENWITELSDDELADLVRLGAA